MSANVDGSGAVTKITAALASANRSAVGIVTVAATPGNPATLQTIGQVPASVTSSRLVGSGPADVIVDLAPASGTYGQPIRTTDYQPARDLHLGVTNAQGVLTLRAAPISNTSKQLRDIRSYGAKTDGATDDAPSIHASMNASGGTVYIPAGVTALNSEITLDQPNCAIRGQHRDLTTLRSVNAGGINCLKIGTAAIKTLEISDITFDGNGYFTNFLKLLSAGPYVDKLVIRRCRFTNFGGGTALILACLRNTLIDDCEFSGYGKALGTGVLLSENTENTTIRDSVFRGLNTGITLNPGGSPYRIQNTKILDNEFDGGVYTLPAQFSGTTTATAIDSLTDPTRDFGALPGGVYLGVARLLVPRVSGVTSGADYHRRMQLIDAAKDFTNPATYTGGIALPGEIIRSGTHQATVLSLANGYVNLDGGWTDTTTYEPTLGPNAGDAYIVYKTIVGFLNTTGYAAGTHLAGVQYGQWLDMNGNPTVPPNVVIYEMAPRAIYQLQISQGARFTLIRGNHVTRALGDGISVFADHTQILGNRIEWCWDQSITVTADYCITSGNEIYKAGKGGIFAGGSYSECNGNVIREWGWSASPTAVGLAYAILSTGNHNQIIGNILNGAGKIGAFSGIQVINNTATDVLDNNIDGLTAGGYEVWVSWAGGGTPQTGVRVRNAGPVELVDPIPGYFAGNAHVELGRLTVAPQGLQAGSPGSLITDASGILYVKASGEGRTGWKVATLGDTPAWAATSIPNCKVWIRAGNPSNVTLIGGLADHVADLGPEAKAPTAPGAGQRMAYSASVAMFGGRGALQTSPTSYMQSAAWGTTLNTARTLLVVGALPAGGSYAGFCDGLQSFETYIAATSTSYAFAQGGTERSGGSSNIGVTKPFVWLVTFDHANAISKIYDCDSREVNAHVYGDAGAVAMTGLTVGSFGTPNTGYGKAGGQICEIAMWSRVLTPTERYAAMLGAANYYGLSIGLGV